MSRCPAKFFVFVGSRSNLSLPYGPEKGKGIHPYTVWLLLLCSPLPSSDFGVTIAGVEDVASVVVKMLLGQFLRSLFALFSDMWQVEMEMQQQE